MPTAKPVAELTLRGLVLGALITTVFTAANVYLGLKVGLTFASSIPAAVISMAVLSVVRNSSILENNIVQTVASAAGTLSAIIFVLPGLLVVRVLKIDELPQRWLAVFLSSLAVNHLAVTIIALLGAKPVVFYAGMVLCLVVALIILEVRRPKFSSAASEIRLSDIFWLVFSLIVLGATYSDIWQRGVPSAFEAPDVAGAWNGWALSWAAGLFRG